MRKLEIGPGPKVSKGFEALDLSPRYMPDVKRKIAHKADASRELPFNDGTFGAIYASHVLEHMPWYRIDDILKEWRRVLSPGGVLEVWVPDALKICKAFIDAEEGNDYTQEDGWYKFNEEKDPCKWAITWLFAFPRFQNKEMQDSNWHRGMFSPRYLKLVLEKAGFVDIERITETKVGGLQNKFHKWIDLGMIARKV